MYTFDVYPVTPQLFQEKKQEIANSGLAITPNNQTTHVAEGVIEGKVLGFHIKLGYRFDGGKLSIDIIDKPAIASNSKVEGKVREWFK